MKLSIFTVDDSQIDIQNLDHESVMDMVEAFGDETTRVMAFELDGAMTYVNKANIVRIDVD